MDDTEHSHTVLVVDDSPTNRMKLKLAIRNLGYNVDEATGGQEALDRLHDGGIDLVLLDIVMPEVDGYDVLRSMRDDAELREIPVLVISSLEDLGDVVQAIDLGAQDFLTKSFDPVFLSARVATCLERKRLRDHELEYIREVRRLTAAAQQIEDVTFDPGDLGISTIAKRDDTLGQLARVFTHMAGEVHRRDTLYRNRITLLRGSFLLLLVGFIWGLMPTLARLGATLEIGGIGAVAWIATASSAVLFVLCLLRGRIPKLTAKRAIFALVIGGVGTIGPQIATFAAAAHVPATVISLILALESLLIFGIAAAFGLEPPSLRRFAGLAVGLVSVVAIIVYQGGSLGISSPIWMAVVLLVPLGYAIESILISVWPEEGDDPLELLTVVTIAGALLVWPIAFSTGQTIPPSDLTGPAAVLILVFSALSCTYNFLIIITLRYTGAVFTGQSAYVVAGAGVIWGVLLLGEVVNVWVWLAIGAIALSLLLVQPNRETETPKPAMA